MDEELGRAEERAADVQLAQAQAASLLKPDAGRDDIFHAARQGLAGVNGKIAPVGWWDSRGEEDASPELELQALNDGSRAQLISAVMLALKETLENIEENNGSLREVIQTVAKVSANDWMGSLSLDIGSQDRCIRVVRAAGDIADEKIWQNGMSSRYRSLPSVLIEWNHRANSRRKQGGALCECAHVFGEGTLFA